MENNNLPQQRKPQEQGGLKQAFNSLFDSFKYMFQSAKGKRSLETYLEIISEFTDDTIIQSKKEGLNYVGGECSMKINPENPMEIMATIELQFQTRDGVWKKKEAKRILEKNTFTDDAIKQIGVGQGLKFEINPPVSR